MPAEVATKADATNIALGVSNPLALAHHAPKMKGTITPAVPTLSATTPTFFRSASLVSRPTENNRRTAPNSARTLSDSLISIQPRTEEHTSELQSRVDISYA